MYADIPHEKIGKCFDLQLK